MAANKRIVPPPPPTSPGSSGLTPVPQQSTGQSGTRLKPVMSEPPSVPPEALPTNPPPAQGRARAEVDEGAKTTELRIPREVFRAQDEEPA